MGLNEFKANVEAALHLLTKQIEGDNIPPWLNESALAGMAEAGLETLPGELGFPLGIAVAKFIRIAREVAEAYGLAVPEQSKEAAAALRTIGEILKSVPTT